MKKALLFFILLSALKIYSQQTAKDSIIYLDEVVVTKKVTKAKIKKLKTKGSNVSGLGMQKLPAEVSLIKDIPEGYLNYVVFDFNSGIVNIFRKGSDVVYKDTELSLVIYAVAQDGSPGEKLNESEVRFVVKEDHRGTLKLNLTPLNLQSRPQLFIGIESLSSEQGNSMVLKLQESKEAVSYTKSKDGKWYRWEFYDFSIQIKMEVGVEVE